MNIGEFMKFILSSDSRIIQHMSKRKNPHKSRIKISDSAAKLRKMKRKMAQHSRRKNRG